jgi:hypothetical protein
MMMMMTMTNVSLLSMEISFPQMMHTTKQTKPFKGDPSVLSLSELTGQTITNHQPWDRTTRGKFDGDVTISTLRC